MPGGIYRIRSQAHKVVADARGHALPGPDGDAGDPRIEPEVRAALERLGAEITPFDARHFGASYPNGNKIEGLAASWTGTSIDRLVIGVGPQLYRRDARHRIRGHRGCDRGHHGLDARGGRKTEPTREQERGARTGTGQGTGTGLGPHRVCCCE